ncbi:MAG TPA: hypothetical protein VL943_11325, partial [Niabella sp.]|nr:hypothetical protein [Niabella sp.]
DYMPRLLNTTEYKNPYLVFRRLLKCHDVPKWRALMDEIIDYAFASYADKCDLNLLALFLHFTKLMEAAHLIDVREITHLGGYLKPGIVLQANP